jgi:positive regulator of sigma E activity
MLLSVARKELLSKVGGLSGKKASRVTLDIPSCDILSVSVLIFFVSLSTLVLLVLD